MTTLDDLRERYIAEYPTYDAIATFVARKIRDRVRRAGLPVVVTSRPKDVPSLVKNALVHGKSYEEIRDRAGARVVYRFPSEFAELDEMIGEAFVVIKRDDKAQDLEPDRLSYRGVHYDVSLRDADVATLELPADVDPICEVQVRTRAEDVWAEYSHELLYKPPMEIPTHVRRSVTRLVVLAEIFDDQVSKARDVVLGQEGHAEAMVIQALERHYYRYSARPYDTWLSRTVVEAVLPLFADEVKASEAIASFVAQADEDLAAMFDRYRNDQRASPLIFQPEVFLLLERLAVAPALLEERFVSVLPRELLADLAVAWGAPLD